MLFESQPRGNSHAVPRREQDAVECGVSVQHKQTPQHTEGTTTCGYQSAS
jgi:hypothetical protein